MATSKQRREAAKRRASARKGAVTRRRNLAAAAAAALQPQPQPTPVPHLAAPAALPAPAAHAAPHLAPAAPLRPAAHVPPAPAVDVVVEHVPYHQRPIVRIAAAILLLMIWASSDFWPLNKQNAQQRNQQAQQSAPATPPGKIQAVEVEFIPLNAVKVATHAHVLHGQDCAGKAGKKVKVRITGADGRKGWDWYTCPQVAS